MNRDWAWLYAVAARYARSDREFWLMTRAQLAALMGVVLDE